MKLNKWKDVEKMRKFKNLSPKKKMKRVFYTIKDIIKYDVFGTCKNVWFWIKARTFTKYHLINITTKDVYKPGYIDCDSAMFLACFKLLERYVEKEHPFEVLNWSWNEEHKKAGDEISWLYNWWKLDYPVLHKKLYFDEMYKVEEEMLERLMKVRPFLWT